MLSTMQDFPLTISAIFRHGRSVFGGSEVVTFEGESCRRATYANTYGASGGIVFTVVQVGCSGLLLLGGIGLMTLAIIFRR